MKSKSPPRRARRAKVYRLDDRALHEIVLERLDRLGISRHALAHHAGVDAAPSTVFRFLSGERNTKTGSVEQILRACGLALVVVDDAPEWIASSA